MLKLSLLIATIFIVGCTTAQEEEYIHNKELLKAREKLPEGCSFNDLGIYKNREDYRIPLIFIKCDNSIVTTNYEYLVGKVWYTNSIIVKTNLTGEMYGSW